MANTITKSLHGLSLSAMDANWLWTESWVASNGVKLARIYLKAGSGTDVLQVRDGSTTGPIIAYISTAATLGVDMFGGKFQPVIVYSECTFSTGHSVHFSLLM